MSNKIKNFKIKNIDNNFFDCFKYQGNNYLLLVFYRGSWCYKCRDQLKELNHYDLLLKRKKIKIVAFSEDNLLNVSLLKNLLKIKFSLLSDPQYKIFKIFSMKKPKSREEIKPAIFFISPKKEILYSYLGKDYKDRPQIKKIIKKLTTII